MCDGLLPAGFRLAKQDVRTFIDDVEVELYDGLSPDLVELRQLRAVFQQLPTPTAILGGRGHIVVAVSD
ncbi:MAG: hypothetical protein ACRELX_01650, partial [Longimicrobiales bacterium]